MGGGALEEVSYILETEDKLCFSYYVVQGGAKNVRKVKNGPTFQPISF